MLAEHGFVGRRGAVTQMRGLPDGRYRYGVGSLDVADKAVVGVYDEEVLRAVGRRAPLDLFRLPGPSQGRDIVTVALDCDQREVAGRMAVVDSGFSGAGESYGSALSIWVEELGESFLV